MASSNTRSNIDWFDVGWKAFKKSRQGAVSFPPLGDREAQRAWLGGFGAAWAPDLDAHTSVDGALVRALEGRAELLRQLRSHASAEGLRTLH